MNLEDPFEKGGLVFVIILVVVLACILLLIIICYRGCNATPRLVFSLDEVDDPQYGSLRRKSVGSWTSLGSLSSSDFKDYKCCACLYGYWSRDERVMTAMMTSQESAQPLGQPEEETVQSS